MKNNKNHHLSAGILIATSVLSSCYVHAEESAEESAGYRITGDATKGYHCEPLNGVTTQHATFKELDVAVQGATFKFLAYQHELRKARLGTEGVTVNIDSHTLQLVKKHHPSLNLQPLMHTRVSECHMEKYSFPMESDMINSIDVSQGDKFSLTKSYSKLTSSYVSVTQSTESSHSKGREVTADMSFSHKGICGGTSATASESETYSVSEELSKSEGHEYQAGGGIEQVYYAGANFIGVLPGVGENTYKVVLTFESTFSGYAGIWGASGHWGIPINSLLDENFGKVTASKTITTELTKVFSSPVTMQWRKFDDFKKFDEALKDMVADGYTQRRGGGDI